jgi:hypothetical protein
VVIPRVIRKEKPMALTMVILMVILTALQRWQTQTEHLRGEPDGDPDAAEGALEAILTATRRVH